MSTPISSFTEVCKWAVHWGYRLANNPLVVDRPMPGQPLVLDVPTPRHGVGRTQLVELHPVTSDEMTSVGQGKYPDGLWINARFAVEEGPFYGPPTVDLNTMMILCNDFGPLGIRRGHPFYYVTWLYPYSGIQENELRESILAVAQIADTYEFNLNNGTDRM